jgi:hypothetical protein
LSRKPKRALELRGIGDFLKGCLLRDAFLGPYSDPLKRKIAFLPVRIHAADLNESWLPVEDRARDIFGRYLGRNRSALRRFVMQLIGAINRIYVLLAGRWANRRHVMEMTARALCGDRAARDYLRRRTKLYVGQIIGKSVGRG